MKKIKVSPGVCGLESIITVEPAERRKVKVSVETKCPAVKKMIEALPEAFDPYSILNLKPGQGPIYEAAANLSHYACPVPSAVIKCIEAEAKLALPRDTSFKFEEE